MVSDSHIQIPKDQFAALMPTQARSYTRMRLLPTVNHSLAQSNWFSIPGIQEKIHMIYQGKLIL
jgi:hypothetical protein